MNGTCHLTGLFPIRPVQIRLEFAIGRLQFKPSMQLSVFCLDPTDLFIIMLDAAIMEDSNAKDIMKNMGIDTDALHTNAQLMNERIVYAMLNKEGTCIE